MGADGFDARAFRDTLSQFCTGVVIATGLHEGEMAGFAAQSFASLSLDPPLVALCPAKTSTSWPKLKASGHFCVNVLGAHQQEVCDQFARKGGVADVPWHKGITGSPILEGVLAYIDCELETEHDGGDHIIAVGRVKDLGVQDTNHGPLLFFRGGYEGFEEG
jgi:3-hydroxy-9,10-secoandrosta-1,3,5(10)-triene-9,17-dione monooxygenase reductase component